MKALEKYRKLDEQLTAAGEKCIKYEKTRQRIFDEMDKVWLELTDEEQVLLSAESYPLFSLVTSGETPQRKKT